MAVVTVPEFSNYLSGMRVTDVQRQSLGMILDGTQSELERYLNRPLQTQRTVEEVDVEWDGKAYMAVTPVNEVYGIYLEGADGQPDRENPIPRHSLPRKWFRAGKNYLELGGLAAYGTVYVDYDGGINGDKNPGLKLAIMRVAAREFMYQHSDTMTLDNTEGRPPSDPTPEPKGWTDIELKEFDRLRRRTVL